MKILQISDIHWHNIHALTDVYRDIREGLIQDIRNYCYEKATIFDHILICGDIAYSGNEVEYRKADEFLNNFVKLLDASRLKYLLYQAITTRIFLQNVKVRVKF